MLHVKKMRTTLALRSGAALIFALLGAGFCAGQRGTLYESEYYDYDSGYAAAEDYGDIPDFNSPNSLYQPSGAGSGYGYMSESYASLAALPPGEIGSDMFLDASTSEEYERRFADSQSLYGLSANSGKGRAPRKVQQTGLFGMPVETNARDGETFYERWVEPDVPSEAWHAQVMPVGVMYPSYLASRKDPHLQSIITYEHDYGTLWDITLGGRAPIFRFGTVDPVQPEGWEIELEGAALLRLDWERGRTLAGTDYRAGVPLVYGTKRWQFKTGYYHVSSHIGDNYLLEHFRTRKHYVRDSVMFGLAFRPVPDVRIYAEADLAFHYDKETTDMMELQFGFEYSPRFYPQSVTWQPRPFFATHAHLYQERDFGGYWATQLGVQWRSPTNSLLRLGAEFYMGGDDLYQYHTTYQRKIGGGIWYDF